MTDRPTGEGHLSPETLADLEEGLLDARETLAARGHLVGCARCSVRQEQLGEVSRLLADHGDVDPMPAEVAARIDEALVAEATAVGTSKRSGPRSPVGMRVLQAAAALVLVLAGVGVGVSALQGGGSHNAETSVAGDAGGGAQSAPRDGAFPITASGQNWSPETVVEAVPTLVAGSFPAASPPAAAEGGGEQDSGAARPQLLAGDLDRLAGGPPLADCVTALAGGPATPLAVDLASWQGNPAAVIVLPTPDDGATVDTWVVGPGCSQADAQVLHFARVARP